SIGGDASPARDADVDTLFERFSAQVFAPLPDTNIGIDRTRKWIDAEGPVTPHNQRPEVALFGAVGRYHLPARLADLFHAVTDLHAVDMRRIEESFNMRIQAKD